MKKISILTSIILLTWSCNTKNNLPTIGFVDAFEDNSLSQAKKGFIDALAKNGFSEEKKTINFLYKNAQGSTPAITQIVQFYKSKNVDCIATCPTISTTAALQQTSTIPIFMMVAPTPDLMNFDGKKSTPNNLFGVAENQDYIDTSLLLIKKIIIKNTPLKVGVIFNQSEPQSVAAINRLRTVAKQNNIELTILPVTTSTETLLVTQSLLSQNIDAFFAMPDNIVFSSFETIVNICNKSKVPVFTSESGLVERGAIAAYGTDLYNWGFECGEQVSIFLKEKTTKNLKWTLVKNRKKMYNPAAAKQFNIQLPSDYVAIKSN
ncbi:MAG: ABC transporter substrate-binding protein [Chitinophagaceae bacterium]